MEFNKDTLIADVLSAAPQTEPLFMSIGMHCLHCVMASGETIEEACEVHGVETDIFIEVLNRFIKDHPEPTW